MLKIPCATQVLVAEFSKEIIIEPCNTAAALALFIPNHAVYEATVPLWLVDVATYPVVSTPPESPS